MHGWVIPALENMDFIPYLTTVYSTPYKTIYLSNTESLCVSVWNEENRNMTHEEYKKDALATLDIIVSSKVKFVIADNRKTKFKFTDDLDLWYRKAFFDVLIKKSHVRKFAIVLSDSLRLSIMVEEMFDRIELDYKHFTSMEDAYGWIKYFMKKK